MNNKLRLLSLVALVAMGTACASEYRTPWISERGPLRFNFKQVNKKDWNWNIWSTFHVKEAHKAYVDDECGKSRSQPLSALIFNKESFRFNEIFPDSDVPMNSENYNPYMRVLRYAPRVHYYEWGTTLGTRFTYPVWKNKGQIGIRGTLPFRKVEMERKDDTDFNAPHGNTVTESQVIRIARDSDGNLQAGDAREILATAYRFDFVASLPDSTCQSILQKTDSEVTLAGTKINYGDKDEVVVGFSRTTDSARTPCGTGCTNIRRNTKAELVAWQRTTGATNIDCLEVHHDQLNGLPKDALKEPSAGTVGYFENGDYTKALDLSSDGFKDAAEHMWVIFKRGTDGNDDERFALGNATSGGTTGASAGSSIENFIEDRVEHYRENAFAFLAEQGYVFETHRRANIGDLDIDVFYEHRFSDEWLAEIFLGVRFPTGTNDNKYGNPYIAHTGNGDHFEIKVGGMFAWQPLDWLNFKADLYYSFVIEDTERRMAVFEGSKIKNVGPRADADVDWGYFVGRFDFNLFHNETSKISSVIGYEIYYKTEDKVSFKCCDMESWLGRKCTFNGDTQCPVFSENKKKLDNCLARKNTEAVAHKLRTETRWQAHRYLEIFAGFTWTFAGQNVFKDCDAHAGFNIHF